MFAAQEQALDTRWRQASFPKDKGLRQVTEDGECGEKGLRKLKEG